MDIKPGATVPDYSIDVFYPNRIYASLLSEGCGVAIVGMIELGDVRKEDLGGYLSIVWSDGGVTHKAFRNADGKALDQIKQIRASALSGC